jgi:hypothetical protein
MSRMVATETNRIIWDNSKAVRLVNTSEDVNNSTS